MRNVLVGLSTHCKGNVRLWLKMEREEDGWLMTLRLYACGGPSLHMIGGEGVSQRGSSSSCVGFSVIARGVQILLPPLLLNSFHYPTQPNIASDGLYIT